MNYCAWCFLSLLMIPYCEFKVINETCGENQFLCTDGKCISYEWICDGARDCFDGSDEMHDACDKHSNANSSCYGNQPECAKHGSLRCIPHEWLCDGHRDCDNGDDETNCTAIHWFRQRESLAKNYKPEFNISKTINTTTPCAPTEYMCSSSKICINLKLTCDGIDDCDDGSDERICKTANVLNVTTTTTSFPTTATKMIDILVPKTEDSTLKFTSRSSLPYSSASTPKYSERTIQLTSLSTISSTKLSTLSPTKTSYTSTISEKMYSPTFSVSVSGVLESASNFENKQLKSASTNDSYLTLTENNYPTTSKIFKNNTVMKPVRYVKGIPIKPVRENN